MPYCTIQEAWGESFYGEKTQPKRFSKIVPEFANPGNLGYYENSYPETNVYVSSLEAHKSRFSNK